VTPLPIIVENREDRASIGLPMSWLFSLPFPVCSPSLLSQVFANPNSSHYGLDFYLQWSPKLLLPPNDAFLNFFCFSPSSPFFSSNEPDIYFYPLIFFVKSIKTRLFQTATNTAPPDPLLGGETISSLFANTGAVFPLPPEC